MTRILITAAAGCILTGGIGYLLLPVLRALKAGQSIREIGPTWHNSKAGHPHDGRTDVHFRDNSLPGRQFPRHER